ncbi:hypothetical protein [Pseudopedobacter beijingensis]|uniref:Uncharacterized protein n=1 Tax=Pseudopedobacter beijingensis TaxID=1207056 RepID=A0ABW4ICN2_9SPHI
MIGYAPRQIALLVPYYMLVNEDCYGYAAKSYQAGRAFLAMALLVYCPLSIDHSS